MSENNNENLNLNENNKTKLEKSKTGGLNIKNIAIALGCIAVLLIMISLFIKGISVGKDVVTTEKLNDDEVVTNEKNKASYDEEKSEINKSLEARINNEHLEPRIETTMPTEDVQPREKTPAEQYLEMIQLEKMQRYYEARKAPFIKTPKNEKTESNTNSANTDDPYGLKDLNSQISQMEAKAMRDMQSIYAGAGQTKDERIAKQKWLANAAKDEFILRKELTPPINRYEVKTGAIIPITLMTSLNSDLPGSILAMVREDVYDTITGTEKVIPAGSKLIGTYSNEVAFGQNRLQAAFNRLILPNGKTISLEGMNMSDMQGKSGIKGKTNTHLGRVIGSVIVSAAIGAVNGLVAPQPRQVDKNAVKSPTEMASEAGTAQALNVAGQYANKVLNVAPTIEIKAGARASIVVEKDIILEKYDKEVRYIID